MSKMGQLYQQRYENRQAVKCNRCHWFGYDYQLKPAYKPNPSAPGDVIPTPACPACLSDQWLEYKED